MLTFIGFDDATSVKKEIGAGAGWLGQHANLYAVGNTLFETLLLNLVFLNNSKKLQIIDFGLRRSEYEEASVRYLPGEFPDAYSLFSGKDGNRTCGG